MGIAWCNDVALVQRRRTARVWINPGGHHAGTNKQAKQRADRVGKQTTGSSPTAKASIGMATYGGKLDASGQPWWLSGGPTAPFKGPPAKRKCASTGMHPLNYSESVHGRKPTTGRQATTYRGTSTGMHTVGCSRMCACQQCCTPLPYHNTQEGMLQQPPDKEEQITTTRGHSSADRDTQRTYTQSKSQQPRGRSRQSQQPDGKQKQIATTRKQSRSWKPENKGPRQIEANKKKAKQHRSWEPENKGPRQIETTKGQIREDRNNQRAVQARSQQQEIHHGNSRQHRSNQIVARNH